MNLFGRKEEEEQKDSFQCLYYYDLSSQGDQDLFLQLDTIRRLIDTLKVRQITTDSRRLMKFLFQKPQTLSSRAISHLRIQSALREDRVRLKALMSLMMAIELSIDKKDTIASLLTQHETKSEEQNQTLIQAGREVLNNVRLS